jgi:hypothetical protein
MFTFEIIGLVFLVLFFAPLMAGDGRQRRAAR